MLPPLARPQVLLRLLQVAPVVEPAQLDEAYPYLIPDPRYERPGAMAPAPPPDIRTPKNTTFLAALCS